MPSRSTDPSRLGKPLRSVDHLRLVVPPAATGAAPAAARPSATAGRPQGDRLWHGLGAVAAAGSAAFATYAMVFSTGQVVPSGNFNVFARYDYLYQVAAQRSGSPGTPPAGAPTGAEPPAARADVAKGNAVDFTPTGSVAAQSERSRGGAGAAARARYDPDSRPLPDFTLRDVFDGKALVESRSSLSVVKPGSMLDGAGEVLSIEKHGEQWVVLTANGVIAGQRR